MKKLLIYCVAVLFCSCAGSSKIGVSNYTTKTSLDGTFFYALPRNTLEFEIKLKKTVLKRGPQFQVTAPCVAQVANQYHIEAADLTALIGAPTVTTTEVEKDGVVLTQGSKADINKIYAIDVNPAFFRDNVVGLTFTQDWILSEASITSENKSFEIGLSAASTLFSTIGLFTKGPAPVPAAPTCISPYADLDNATAASQSFLSNPSTAYTPESFTAAKTTRQNMIQELFEKFFYEKKETSYSVKFSFDLPNGFANGATQNLFAVDESTGKIEINSIYAANIKTSTPDKIIFSALAGKPTIYTINAAAANDDVYATIKSRLNTSNPAPTTTGLVYNIPATIDLTITKTSAVPAVTVVKSSYKFAQFGTTGSINSKFTKAGITLDPLTGSLTKASAESKSISSSNITGGGDVVGKAKTAFTKPTETEELEKKIKLLELKAKLKALEGEE